MVNTNIEAKIPLIGSGLVYEPDGDVQPGQFSAMRNLVRLDDKIRLRNPLMPPKDYGNTASTYRTKTGEPILDTFGFIGHYRGGPVIVSQNDHWGIHTFGFDIWREFKPSALPQPAGGFQSFNYVLGCFEYNNKFYWVSDFYSSNGVTTNNHDFYVMYRTANISDNGGEPYFQTAPAIPENRVKVFTLSYYDRLSAAPAFIRSFIHKDRLFIITKGGVYFSKATDPTIFATPDGGFVKIPNCTIVDAVGLGDTIYISTTNGIYVFTYSADPNTDGYLRQITQPRGYGPLTVLDGRVFVVDQTYLYSINNGQLSPIVNMSKVRSTTKYSGQGMDIPTKLVGFNRHLYILVNNREASYSGTNIRYTSLPNYYEDTYVYDVDTGFMSTFYAKDARDIADDRYKGYVSDMYAPPAVFGNPEYLYVLLTYYDSVNDKYKSRVYRMLANPNLPSAWQGADRNNPPVGTPAGDINFNGDAGSTPGSRCGMDRLYTSYDPVALSTLKKHRIPFRVRMDNWSPDGNEFLLKKFRTLILKGVISPWATLLLRINSIDASSLTLTSYTPQTPVIPNKASTPDDVLPIVYPFMVQQRASNIGLDLAYDPFYEDQDISNVLDINSDSYLVLEDARIFWLHTQKPSRE